jgi:anti-sigma factor RsiW
VTCQEFIDFLMAYLDGELAPEATAVFEKHMQLCSPCVDYLESYKSTVAMGRQACADKDAEVPSDVPEGLLKAILEARKRLP